MTATASTRGFWLLRDIPTVAWLAAAGAVALVHPLVPAPRWLMLHLLLLGALGHAILVWSRHFADALLRTPAGDHATTLPTLRIQRSPSLGNRRRTVLR